MVKRIIIMGAAGRDFHNFNILYRDNPEYRVMCFTAAQIPYITGRVYPSELAGKLYPKGIPIYPEEKLPKLIKKYKVDECILSYSDLSHQDVMVKAAVVNTSGADFKLVSPFHTMLKSKKPVIAVCAVRTGCGKSQTTRKIVEYVKKLGKKPVVVRHPMPYGDLKAQVVQRFSTYSDLDKHHCTIEEREEYEQHIKNGITVYAGIDYKKILRKAEKEGDVIIWDGGNNDTPFFKPDLHVVITDALRPGHEKTYYPGLTNLMMADLVIINKVNSGKKDDIEKIVKNIKHFNPKAKIIKAESVLKPDKTIKKGVRAVVVEDGPTLTHGGMPFGAGYMFAKKIGVKIIKPFAYAQGSIRDTYRLYPHLKDVLPAMGYSDNQINDLKKTILKIKPEVVIAGTPISIESLLKLDIPVVHVKYDLKEKGTVLKKMISDVLSK